MLIKYLKKKHLKSMKDNYNNYSYWFLSLLLYRNVDPRFFVIPPKDKLAYLVLPKNACSSIKSALISNKEKGHNVHFSSVFSKEINKIPKKRDNYYKFTFVRNPFERLVSCYVNKFEEYKKWDKFFLFEKYYLFGYLKKTDSFEKFVKKISKLPDFLSDSHFQSQYSRIYKNKKPLVDYIGKIETLDKDFKKIKSKFKLKDLPHLNKTKKKYDWRNYYSIELVELVYKRYKKDCDLWYPNEHNKLLKYLK